MKKVAALVLVAGVAIAIWVAIARSKGINVFTGFNASRDLP